LTVPFLYLARLMLRYLHFATPDNQGNNPCIVLGALGVLFVALPVMMATTSRITALRVCILVALSAAFTLMLTLPLRAAAITASVMVTLVASTLIVLTLRSTTRRVLRLLPDRS
jgi:hypothetical protein